MTVDHIVVEDGSDNVFADIGFAPEAAARLLLKAELVSVIRKYRDELGLSQLELSRLVDIPQSRLSRLFSGKIGDASTDKLLGAIAKLGGHVTIRVEAHPENGKAGRVDMELA